jgi:hypothetical protein
MKLLISIGVFEGSNPTLSATANKKAPSFGAFLFAVEQGVWTNLPGFDKIAWSNFGRRGSVARRARARMARVNPTLSAT